MTPGLLDAVVEYSRVILEVDEIRFSPRVHLGHWGNLVDLVKNLLWELKMNVEPKGRVQIGDQMYDYRLESLSAYPGKVVVVIDLPPGVDLPLRFGPDEEEG